MHTKAYQEEGVYKDNLYDPGKCIVKLKGVEYPKKNLLLFL